MRSWLYDILQSETLQGADIEPASGRHMDRCYPPCKNCIMCHHKLCASCIANCGHIVHHRGLLASDVGQLCRTNQVHCVVCVDGHNIEVRLRRASVTAITCRRRRLRIRRGNCLHPGAPQRAVAGTETITSGSISVVSRK